MRKSRVTIVGLRLQIKQRFIGRERSNYGFAYENVRVTGGLGVRHERIGGYFLIKPFSKWNCFCY